MTIPPPAGERGSATVWVLALAGVLALVGAAAVLVGAAVVARHRATAAADLAALAAAGRELAGHARACAAAEEIAAANAAEVISCTVGAGAVVEVAVRVRVELGGLGVHSATARPGRPGGAGGLRKRHWTERRRGARAPRATGRPRSAGR
jgi:secretion/DNA translocation related TadE-like protein